MERFVIEEHNDPEVQQQDDMHLTQVEESYFLKLFTRVLNYIIDEKNVMDHDIIQSLPLLKASFCPPQDFHEIDFTEYENICAFLYRYSSHGAGFARFRILNAIRNCETLKNIMKKPHLKIVCLGSGPGNDAVGLCSALSELQFPKTMTIFLVDKFKEWSLCIDKAVDFIKGYDYGKVSKLFANSEVEFSFIQVDLPGDMESDKEYFEILGKADVIFMSKFLSSLDRSHYGQKEKDIIQSLSNNMKKDAVIVVNDMVVFIEDRWKDFTLLYKWGEGEENEYKSTALAEERFNSDDDIKSKLPIHVFVKKN